MLKLESILIHTAELELLTKFLVQIFEMEIMASFTNEVELQLAGQRFRLLRSSAAQYSGVIRFAISNLEEIEQLKQRISFFYFSQQQRPRELYVNKLDSDHLISFLDPEGRAWEVLYLNNT